MLDPLGSPVAGAWVRLGGPGTTWEPAGPRGELLLHGTSGSRRRLQALHPDWGSWDDEVLIDPKLEPARLRLGGEGSGRSRWPAALERVGITSIIDRAGRVVSEVSPDSAAARAGLQRRDLLLWLDEKPSGLRLTVWRGNAPVYVDLVAESAR